MMIFGILVEIVTVAVVLFQAVRAGRGLKGQKIAKMKNNNYIRLAPHLWNSIVDGHDFWYTCVK